MSLPLNVTDRLFDRLAATYGREWFGKWEGVDTSSVKSLWSHELASFTDRLDAIAWALENLPAKCPNAIEFKNLCRQAPIAQELALEVAKADPAVVNKELAKMAGQAFKAPTDSRGNVDHKRWAKRLKERHEKGEKLNLFQINAYREALDIKVAA